MNNYRVLHTIAGLGVNQGGTTTCTYNLVSSLNKSHVKADILTFDISDSTDRLIGTDSFIKTVKPDQRTSFAYSKNFRDYLLKHPSYDLYHINGFWQYPICVTAQVAREYKKSYIITPHGMLYPHSFKKGRWKKNMLMSLTFRRDLEKAFCIHATCEKEMIYLRELGIQAPIAVIPNITSIPSLSFKKEEKERKIVGYLGRLHPRKNVERLINAWGQLGETTKEAELVIMGDGDPVYKLYLEKEAKRLGINNIKFLGFVDGEEKFKILSSLSFLVVPSDFENFGMIVTEALAMGTPVIASKGTPWEDLETYKCGRWVDNDVKTLARTIENMINLTNEEITSMGKRGEKLVREKYAEECVVSMMESLYNWILKGGETPSFVHMK